MKKPDLIMAFGKRPDAMGDEPDGEEPDGDEDYSEEESACEEFFGAAGIDVPEDKKKEACEALVSLIEIVMHKRAD
jgi:hypothetical protein